MHARPSHSTAQFIEIARAYNQGLHVNFAVDDAHVVRHLVEAIRPLLAGFQPEIQSSVLADLLAMWLAGMQGSDASEVRDLALLQFLSLVNDLIKPNEAEIMARIPAQGRS